MEWNKSLETGIELIDAQHEELISRIDKLELGLYKGRATPELARLLEYMESYVTEHFETEEKLMLEVNYPGYAQHVHEHNLFRETMINIIESCKEKGLDSYLAIDVDRQMRKWFENHILKTDMAYVPYLKKQ